MKPKGSSGTFQFHANRCFEMLLTGPLKKTKTEQCSASQIYNQVVHLCVESNASVFRKQSVCARSHKIFFTTLRKCLFAHFMPPPPSPPFPTSPALTVDAADVVYVLTLIKLLRPECGMISMLAVIACRDSNSPLS